MTSSTKERKKQLSSSAQRKKQRYSASQKITQRSNERKLRELKKQRKNVKYNKRGKKLDTKPNLISNIGKNADFGQRAAKLKVSMGGIGSMKDYKKSEKKTFKEAEKFKKKQAKEKLKIKKDKERKNKTTTTGGGGTRTSGTGTGVRSKFIKYKGKMLRRGTPQAKKAEAAETARKKLGAKGYMR